MVSNAGLTVTVATTPFCLLGEIEKTPSKNQSLIDAGSILMNDENFKQAYKWTAVSHWSPRNFSIGTIALIEKSRVFSSKISAFAQRSLQLCGYP